MMLTMRAMVLLLLTSTASSAADYCSLTVQVSDGHGNHPTGISVTVVEGNGRTEAGVTKDGVAKFCDLGLSSVDITVGEADGCAEVVVRNVDMSWGVEKTVGVIHNRDYCNEDEIHAVGCSTLLRFIDQDGKSIPDVRLDPPIGMDQNAHSDSHGRALITMRAGQSMKTQARSKGKRPESVEVGCNPPSSRKEVLVTLHDERAPAPRQ